MDNESSNHAVFKNFRDLNFTNNYKLNIALSHASKLSFLLLQKNKTQFPGKQKDMKGKKPIQVKYINSELGTFT